MYTKAGVRDALRALFGDDNPRVIDLGDKEYQFVIEYANPVIEGDRESEVEIFQDIWGRKEYEDPLSLDREEREERAGRTIRSLRESRGEGERWAEIWLNETTEGESILTFEREGDLALFHREYCRLYQPFVFAVVDSLLGGKDEKGLAGKGWKSPNRELNVDFFVEGEDLVDIASYSENWATCEACGRAVEIEGWGSRHKYYFGDGEIICRECIRKDPDWYIERFVDGGRGEGIIDTEIVDPVDEGWVRVGEEYSSEGQAGRDGGWIGAAGIDWLIVSRSGMFRTVWHILVREEDEERGREALEEGIKSI